MNALVTGANRGIGFEVARELAKQGIETILGCRDLAKGEAAVKKLAAEKLGVHLLELDVTNQRTIDAAYDWIVKKFGRLDILINNAGILIDKTKEDEDFADTFSADAETIRASLETNTLGPFRMCQKFVPLMMKNGYGRVVNLSSRMGQLSEMNGGWPGYRISKTALNAVTRIFSEEAVGTNVLVNSVCPGWVKTDMGGPDAERTTEEAADTILWLATQKNGPLKGGITGGFFRDRKPIEW